MSMEFRKRFLDALPVIVFFLLLFYTVVFSVGTNYALIVSITTTAFKVNFKKKMDLPGIFLLLCSQIIICVLAFLATLNIPLCVILNGIVPFVLIYLQSSQFNQKGYFVSAMTFIFLQLRPVGWDGILSLLGIMALASGCLVVGLLLYSAFHKKTTDYTAVKKGIMLLSQDFCEMSGGNAEPHGLQENILQIQATLHRRVYSNRDLIYLTRYEGEIHYMFALMFQRAAYYILDFGESIDENTENNRKIFYRLGIFLNKVNDTMNTADNSEIIKEAESLMKETSGLTERFATFLRNFLRLLIMALKGMTEVENKPHPQWKLPVNLRPISGLRASMRLNQFEVRFALRLSMTAVISFLVVRFTNSEHSYWLPLNAFLLLQPMYEESAYRIKTRLFGSSIGCLLSYFALMLFSGITGHLIFATVMITLMYCSTPGKWVQPIFSTSFALSLASLSIGSTAAVEFRLLYLGLAIGLVFFINRFFFPTSAKGQFKFNIRELFRIQDSYMSMLETSLLHSIDSLVLSDSLVHFHLLQDEIRKYADKNCKKEEQRAIRSMTLLMWRMLAEAEQMIVFIQRGELAEEKRGAVLQFSHTMRRCFEKGISPKQEILSLPCTESPFFDVLEQHYYCNLNELQKLIGTEKGNLLFLSVNL